MINVSSVLLNNTSSNPIFVTSIDFSFDVGVALGLLGLAFAVWFGFGDKLREFLFVSKKREVDEKIAMFYGYAAEVQSWQKNGIDVDLILEKILADIRAVGRIKKSVKDEQKESVITAKNRLVSRMRTATYEKHADRIDEVFKSSLWA
jgi:hypothetical protein